MEVIAVVGASAAIVGGGGCVWEEALVGWWMLLGSCCCWIAVGMERILFHREAKMLEWDGFDAGAGLGTFCNILVAVSFLFNARIEVMNIIKLVAEADCFVHRMYENYSYKTLCVCNVATGNFNSSPLKLLLVEQEYTDIVYQLYQRKLMLKWS